MTKFANLIFLLLSAAVLTTACISDEAQRKQERQFLESILNGSVGKSTYEQVMTTFGPPGERSETSSTITGIWEDMSSAGFRADTPGSGIGGLTSLRGERVKMVFDRRTQLMKSWEYAK